MIISSHLIPAFAALLLLLLAAVLVVAQTAPPRKPPQLAHTYSIVARDPNTGELGVAVQMSTSVPITADQFGAIAGKMRPLRSTLNSVIGGAHV